ncbi:MAG: hemolysin family protein [Methanobacteriota archaeon]
MATLSDDPTWLLGVKLGLVAFFLLLNAFFVAAEFAIVKVRSTQLAGTDRRRESARKVVGQLDEYLSVCQLGITAASLALGWLGEPVFAAGIRPVVQGFGIQSEAAVSTIAIGVAFTILTGLHIVIGELVPKSIAIRAPERSTVALAPPLRAVRVLLGPFVWAMNGLANLLLRTAGFSTAPATEAAMSEDELRHVISAMGGAAKEPAAAVLRRKALLKLFELKHLTVADILVPRSRVVTLDVKKTLQENLQTARSAGYTRFPLVDGSLENVLGMIHLKDLVWYANEGGEEIERIRREILIVPAVKQVEQLLEEFLRRGQNLAVVVDELGNVDGIVTLEDILEEVFGEIRDETETAPAFYKKLGEDHYLVDALVHVQDLEELLRTQIPARDVTTLGGYLVERLGHLPNPEEAVENDGWTFVVRTADRKRVKTVEVRRTKR